MLGLLQRRAAGASAPDRSQATRLQVQLPDPGAHVDVGALEAALRNPRTASVTHLDLVARGALDEPVTQVLRALLRAAPAVRDVELVLPSVGREGAYPMALLEGLALVAKERNAELVIGFVLDADADAFELFAERPTSLRPALEASRHLEAGGAQVRWWVPLLPALPYRLEAIFTTARDLGVDPVLVPAWALPFTDARDVEPLDEDLQLFAQDFVTYRLLDEDRGLATPERLAYYAWLEHTIDGGGPRRPAGARPVAALVLDGAAPVVELVNQPNLGDAEALAPKEETPSRLDRLKMQAADMSEVLLAGDRALLKWVRSQPSLTLRPPPVLGPDSRLRKVVVIGAYGGEHIGDMAILGGVLLRVHRRFGVSDAILMSQRADHTRRLVKNLDLPVRIVVEPYEPNNIKASVSRADGVVYAGGPLMDLPKQLVRHLYTASTARAQGKPLILEGIGAGPFTRAPSEWVGRRLTTMASSITVRTATDAEQGIVRGLSPKIGRDPAFDYLDSRPEQLTKVTDEDQRWIDRMLEGTEGRLVIGINLRPIRAMFTVGAPADQKVEHTRRIVARFEQRLGEAMVRFAEVSDKPPCYVYYSMNSIQFGSPDLRCAFELLRHCGTKIDYRIWQADPGIDAVVALLRRLDLVIAMRFHANIFALSQGVPTIGIDYRPGKKDKVAALHQDRGTIDQVSRIDEMTVDWMVERLRTLSAGRA